MPHGRSISPRQADRGDLNASLVQVAKGARPRHRGMYGIRCFIVRPKARGTRWIYSSEKPVFHPYGLWRTFMMRCGHKLRVAGMSHGQGVVLAVMLGFTVALFLLGLYFIRKPQAPARLFSFGRPPHRFVIWATRAIGYLFCSVCVAYLVLTPLYLIALSHQHNH